MDKANEIGSIVNEEIGNPLENTGEEITKVRVLTEEAANGEIKGFIATLQND